MKIDRPLFIYDLETTTNEPNTAKIVSMSYMFFPYGTTSPTHSKSTFLVDPQTPIPREASNVHGITDEMVFGKPLFCEHVDELMALLSYENLILCGYNNRRFDDVILQRELAECGIEFDTQTVTCLDLYALWSVSEPRTLTGAVSRFLGESLDDAHDAEADTKAVQKLIKPFLNQFGSILSEDYSEWNRILFPKEAKSLDRAGKIVLNDRDKPSLSFGKHMGTDLDLVDKGYLNWVLKQDFPEDTKEIVRRFL